MKAILPAPTTTTSPSTTWCKASWLSRKPASRRSCIYATGGHAFGGNILNPPVPLVGDWSHRLEAWMKYKKLFEPNKTL
jgi:hypothetical protein